jgi:hypothetical protein
MSDIKTIDHRHRKYLRMSLEEYIVAQEIFSRRDTAVWAFPLIIARKTGMSENRVDFIINRLNAKKLIKHHAGGYVLAGIWHQSFAKYYRPME